MKTFFNLVQEVLKPGLCHRCGGCVSFCTAINYGALELGEEGMPRYSDMEKCIECGICYAICPEIGELDEEIKRKASWSAPMGRIIGTSVARAKDPEIRKRATDGGLVTSLLLHLLDSGHIDGAIVTRKVGPFKREPWLARSREEIIQAAGFHFDTSHGMKAFGDAYSTFSPSVHELAPMARAGLRRVAFVGTPCQIKTVRKMEALGIVPSDSIKIHLGLFCTGNFSFGSEQRRMLEDIGNFRWVDVRNINVKESLRVHLQNGEIRSIPLEDLDFMKRFACRFCDDYSAEYSDLSFGGIGASQGWTTVITRTPLGRAVFHDARGRNLEEYTYEDDKQFASQALKTVEKWSDKKKETATENRKDLGNTPVTVMG